VEFDGSGCVFVSFKPEGRPAAAPVLGCFEHGPRKMETVVEVVAGPGTGTVLRSYR
jgi:hypothetical protein